MNAIRMVIARNVLTEELTHHLSLIEGVLSPTIAKMILEKPTGSAEEKNHDNDPIR
jgi:hypothetical protein